MGDRLAARHFAFGPFDIDGEPVADPNLLADILGKVARAFDLDHRGSPFGIGAAAYDGVLIEGSRLRVWFGDRNRCATPKSRCWPSGPGSRSGSSSPSPRSTPSTGAPAGGWRSLLQRSRPLSPPIWGRPPGRDSPWSGGAATPSDAAHPVRNADGREPKQRRANPSGAEAAQHR